MTKAVFADTGYFIALQSKRDQLHPLAAQVSRTLENSSLVTSDFVILEFLQNFSAADPRVELSAHSTVEILRSNPTCDVVPASRELLDEGMQIYLAYADKKWSIVDCISFCIMRSRGIQRVLSADRHFERMGYTCLLR